VVNVRALPVHSDRRQAAVCVEADLPSGNDDLESSGAALYSLFGIDCTSGASGMLAFESEVEWCEETQTLSGWTTVNGRRVRVDIPRHLIHTLPVYNDAVGWEIERFKLDILERLKPQLFARAAE
jgi:hypothetical protein